MGWQPRLRRQKTGQWYTRYDKRCHYFGKHYETALRRFHELVGGGQSPGEAVADLIEMFVASKHDSRY